MARIFTEGFEMGDGLVFVNSTFGVSSGPRSGTYCGSGGNGRVNITETDEIYIRFGIKFTHATSTYRFKVSLYNGTTQLGYIELENIYNNVKRVNLYINGSLVASGTIGLAISNWYLYEFYYKLADFGGVVTTKINGIEDINYSGDTKPDDNTGFDNIYFESSIATCFDDIAINDTTGTEDNSWCGDGHIIAIKPNGNGDSSQLTGSDGDSVDNYLLVDDIPSDGDTTYVWGNVLNNQDLYNLEAPNLPVNHTITRVWAEARAKDPDVGDIALPIKSGATQDDGTAKGLTTAYSAIKGDEYTTNPDTGIAWTESDLNALQAGVKIKS